MHELTHDPLSLGFVGLAEALPFLALTLLGGWEADRRDRRALSLWGLLAVALSGLVLLVTTVTVGAVAWAAPDLRRLLGIHDRPGDAPASRDRL